MSQNPIRWLRERAAALKQQLWTLYLAYRHPQTPWYARILPLLVIAYAVSPVDLIPDFIPVLGFLDDVFLLPGGIWLCIRLIPREVWEECREQACQNGDMPIARRYRILGAVLVGLIWAALLAAVLWVVLR